MKTPPIFSFKSDRNSPLLENPSPPPMQIRNRTRICHRNDRQNNPRRKTPQHGGFGFTLIELLVVVIIITIVALLLLPAARTVFESAQTSQCLSRQRTLAVACLAFASENNGQLPVSYSRNVDDEGQTSFGSSWYYDIEPYMGGDKVAVFLKRLRCPAASKTNSNRTIGVHQGQGNNSSLGPCVTGDNPKRRRVSVIPTHTALTGDTDNNVGVYLNPVVWPFTTDQDGDGIRDSHGNTRYNGLGFRHGGKAPVVCVDGSAKIIRVDEWVGNTNNLWGVPIP